VMSNYKSLMYFMMIQAYLDAGDKAQATSFGRKDVFLAIIYFSCLFPLRQVMSLITGADPDSDGGWNPPSHRWYLGWMLWNKAVLALLQRLRVPPAAQVSAFVLAGMLAPIGLNQWGRPGYLYSPLSFLDETLFSSEGGFTLLSAYMVTFTALYLAHFHYLRPLIVQPLVLRFPRVGTTYSRMVSASCLVSFILIAIVYEAPNTNTTIYEAPKLTVWQSLNGWTGEILSWTHVGDWIAAMLGGSVMALLLAGASMNSPVHLKTMGSTTLGAYVIHFYLFPMTCGVPDGFVGGFFGANPSANGGFTYNNLLMWCDGWGGGVATLLCILVMPVVLMQATIGPLFYYGMMKTLTLSEGAVLKGYAALRQ